MTLGLALALTFFALSAFGLGAVVAYAIITRDPR